MLKGSVPRHGADPALTGKERICSAYQSGWYRRFSGPRQFLELSGRRKPAVLYSRGQRAGRTYRYVHLATAAGDLIFRSVKALQNGGNNGIRPFAPATAGPVGRDDPGAPPVW